MGVHVTFVILGSCREGPSTSGMRAVCSAACGRLRDPAARCVLSLTRSWRAPLSPSTEVVEASPTPPGSKFIDDTTLTRNSALEHGSSVRTAPSPDEASS